VAERVKRGWPETDGVNLGCSGIDGSNRACFCTVWRALLLPLSLFFTLREGRKRSEVRCIRLFEVLSLHAERWRLVAESMAMGVWAIFRLRVDFRGVGSGFPDISNAAAAVRFPFATRDSIRSLEARTVFGPSRRDLVKGMITCLSCLCLSSSQQSPKLTV
jgi:hypothetical protein